MAPMLKRVTITLIAAVGCVNQPVAPNLDANDNLATETSELAGSLTAARDRLIDSLAARNYRSRCSQWNAMTPSAQGVFLVSTDLLAKRMFAYAAERRYYRYWIDDCSYQTECTYGCSVMGYGGVCEWKSGPQCQQEGKCGSTENRTNFETMIDHVTQLYSVAGQGGWGCIWAGPFPTCCSDNGGGDANRVFFGADAQLITQMRTPVGISNPGWRNSEDLKGPHAPFSRSLESMHGLPRAQTHFWGSSTEGSYVNRPGLGGVYDPNIVEMDLDYNFCHDSNPDGYYDGVQGRVKYEQAWQGQGLGGSAELGYRPTGC